MKFSSYFLSLSAVVPSSVSFRRSRKKRVSIYHAWYLPVCNATTQRKICTKIPVKPSQAKPLGFLAEDSSSSFSSRPNSNIIHSHWQAAHSRRSRSRTAIDSIRIRTSHCNIKDKVKPLVDSLIPDGAGKLTRLNRVFQRSIEPEFDLFGLRSSVDDHFVDVVVSWTSGTSAGSLVSDTVGFVACAAWVFIL